VWNNNRQEKKTISENENKNTVMILEELKEFIIKQNVETFRDKTV
jgi:hypothetical protein